MSSVKIKGSPTGTAAFTIAVPDGTSTDRTIELPDAAGSFVLADASGDVSTTGTLSVNNADGITVTGNYALIDLIENDITDRNTRLINSGGDFRIDTISDDKATATTRVVVEGDTGNLLVGTTTRTNLSNGTGNTGHSLDNAGQARHTADSGEVMFLNRLTDDGDIAVFRKDGTTVGSIGVEDSNLVIDGGSNSGWRFFSTSIRPRQNGALIDNVVDLGGSSHRMDDIYASNGTIQTSDANEKQQIASLTDAEITAAKAISKLFKTFKWNDKVAEKGDAARTHSGVIAQEVEQAMTDAGLDAGNYAFFIRGVWWEADETYTDDDGVEQTRTNAYTTAEEAPEGATERTRLGIRYPELLAFIGAATEQRLASIEARLDALEAV